MFDYLIIHQYVKANEHLTMLGRGASNITAECGKFMKRSRSESHMGGYIHVSNLRGSRICSQKM